MVIATLLALSGVVAGDPWIVLPCLFLSWAGFIYLCVAHEGSRRFRIATGVVITLVLSFVSLRTYSHAFLENQPTTVVKGAKQARAPRLEGMISGVLDGEGANGVTCVLPLLSITNRGSPTIVDIEAATIKCGDKPFIGLRSIIYEEGTQHVFQTGVETIKRSDMIAEKLATPIPRGGRTSGWLMYELRDIGVAELRRKGYQIIIPFKDAFGNEYKVSTPPANKMGEGEPGYLPGANNPFLRHFGELPVPRPTPPPSPTPDTEASPP